MEISRKNQILKIYLPADLLSHLKSQNKSLFIYGEIKLLRQIKNNIYDIFIENFTTESNLQNNIGSVFFNTSLKSISDNQKYRRIFISIDKDKLIKYNFCYEKTLLNNSNSKCMMFFYEKKHQSIIKSKLYRHEAFSFDSKNYPILNENNDTLKKYKIYLNFQRHITEDTIL